MAQNLGEGGQETNANAVYSTCDVRHGMKFYDGYTDVCTSAASRRNPPSCHFVGEDLFSIWAVVLRRTFRVGS